MKHILLLRAVNLGKYNKVSMQELKLVLTSLGYTNIKTLLQSGNVALDSDTFDKDTCELKLKETFGFDIPIIITDHATLVRLSQHTLFNEKTMIVFTNSKFTIEMLELLQSEVREVYEIDSQCILINYSIPYHESKYNNNWFERKLKLKTTIRNRNTVLKMIESFK